MKKKYLILASLFLGAFQLTAQSPHFFGVTTNGGGDEAGTIYRTDTNGTNFSLIDTFDISKNGTRPDKQELVEVNGKLYGVTYSGGDNDEGVLFEFDPSTGSYTIRHHFDDSTGRKPQCYLLLGSNGKIYGTTTQGGSNNNGVVFEFNTTTNILIRKQNMGMSAVTGRTPVGKMVEYSPGIFYGVCRAGGALNSGTVFKYTLSTNIIEKKDDFNNLTSGSQPLGGLMKASNGILYGMSGYGGPNGAGALFQYDLTADSIKTLVQFDGNNGRNGQGVPFQVGGDLYGLTNYGTYTSGTGKGILFKYNIAGDTITRMRTFGAVTPGYYPSGELVPSTAGKYLILMRTGGYNRFAGTIAEYTLATNTITGVASFDRPINGTSPMGNLKKSSVNGKYYGIASHGGSGDFGTIFEYDPANNDTIINKHSFSPSNNGKRPTGTLVKAPNGKLYGITSSGGIHGYGTIFEVDPVTENVVKKIDFDASIGKSPVGGLTVATNGKLYGVTSNGGLIDAGVIFEYDIATNTIVKLKDISPLGKEPNASLIQATNGKLYGTTSFGGIGYGTVFSYNITLDSLKGLDNFDGITEGGYPYGKLLQANSGKLYGTTSAQGTHGKGAIYEFDIAVDSIRVIDNFTDSNGANPYGGLTQITNGNIYGVANRGSINGIGVKYGVVYQLDIAADTIIPLANYIGSVTGYGGYGELLEASNGKLYITSDYTTGGTRSASINEFDPITGTFVAKMRLPSGQTAGSLIELVSPNNASIDENETAQELLVFPNPTSSIINIDTKGARIVGLKIFNVSGQLIDSRLKGNNTIDVSQYKSGMYIIQVETQNGIALSRFIKK